MSVRKDGNNDKGFESNNIASRPVGDSSLFRFWFRTALWLELNCIWQQSTSLFDMATQLKSILVGQVFNCQPSHLLNGWSIVGDSVDLENTIDELSKPRTANCSGTLMPHSWAADNLPAAASSYQGAQNCPKCALWAKKFWRPAFLLQTSSRWNKRYVARWCKSSWSLHCFLISCNAFSQFAGRYLRQSEQSVGIRGWLDNWSL